jgi:nicotinamidase-related amidase
MSSSLTLLEPDACTLVLVDQQAGLAFGVGSEDRQVLLNNTIALGRTALAFGVPIIASTSATKVYSGPMMPALHAAIPDVVPIDRRNMNIWEDDAVRNAIRSQGRKRLLISGLLSEACVTFGALSALADGFEVFVIADACGGITPTSHHLALRRLERAGVVMTSWIQVLLEFQRDWTRKKTYDAARAIVETNGGGYGIGLAYSRDMIHPT